MWSVRVRVWWAAQPVLWRLKATLRASPRQLTGSVLAGPWGPATRLISSVNTRRASSGVRGPLLGAAAAAGTGAATGTGAAMGAATGRPFAAAGCACGPSGAPAAPEDLCLILTCSVKRLACSRERGRHRHTAQRTARARAVPGWRREGATGAPERLLLPPGPGAGADNASGGWHGPRRNKAAIQG